MTVADNILIDDDDIDAITDNVDNIYKSINDTKIKNKLRLSKLMNKLDNAVIRYYIYYHRDYHDYHYLY